MDTSALPLRIAFGSKAETLERLAPHLRTAHVLDLVRFRAVDWNAGGMEAILDRIATTPWGRQGPLIVRSSAAAEDREGQSLAGHFVSIGNVDPAGLPAAVAEVAASFGDEPVPADQIFVQPMLTAAMSGVAFTRDPNTGAPYLIVNYEEGGDTAAVTGGHAAELKTFVYWKGATVPCPSPLDRVVALAGELEGLLGGESLDIEFAFSPTGELYLFQVRPLSAACGTAVGTDEHRPLLEAIAQKIAQANRPHPYLRGRRTLYGVMPDWNPAEIIGIRPRPLALSLYRQLVTDSVWAYQRHNYGYRNLRSFPLMRSFHGLPYIDVRLSFNSFIPGDVPDTLADRLVDCYIDQLAAAPVLHDKVEFEIVFSCYTFDLDTRLQRLRGFGFSERDLEELTQSLRRLTNRVIHRETGLWRNDSKKIGILEERQRTIRTTDMDIVSRIYWLMEDCKRYGTLPFAGLARAGFIAVQMLKSLVAVGAIEPQQYDAFMTSLETVSGRMTRDLRALSRSEFLEKYGHLRPGTYDILSPRYDEDPERYLGAEHGAGPHDEGAAPTFALSLPQMRRIDALLNQHSLEMDVVSLFDFCQAGIQGREHSKFVFTRSLSEVLSLLTRLGERYGLSPDDMSYFDASLIDDLYASSCDIEATLRHSISQGRARYAETQRIVLPPLISQPEEVWAFHIPPTEPNFITQRTVEGPVRSHKAPASELKGAVVVIPSADPGFDWIFSHGIGGFITAYGGVNSHMAIRAGELNLPAVIGAGETLFNQWKDNRRLRIDCASRRVDVLQ
ncbi:phosphoenolpyruvate synthase [Azospirillum thiophilum]|uniref:Phosphoenolpyruvate synthase n=1 Tax=Azospirillum thiophilum TaxID=528244 RepID=A0AAC8W5U1_9PROT|nr:PEP-utilizing enzyme [Azospirillum thiophilum]ALG75539.1 phosphoenolpyruvate synthase [Azospirillum thiophilum]KJR62059.1 phosphoenolpyruvate synthase [Azospirillum thiophilum]